MPKRAKGFTLIEMIVVVAVIGVLAMIIIPSMLSFMRNAKVQKYNTNAKHIHQAANLAIHDAFIQGKDLPSEVVYTGGPDGQGESAGNIDLDLAKYLGASFEGYFGFKMEGSEGAAYCLWSENPIGESDVVLMSLDDVKNSMNTPGAKGCYPVYEPVT